jgi:hypothetical protein
MTLICSSAFSADFVKKPARWILSWRPGTFDYHFEKRGEHIMTKEKLLAHGDRLGSANRR